MKIYSGAEMEDIKNLHHRAEALPPVAIKLRDVVRQNMKDGPAKVFDVHFLDPSGTDIMLDFKLGTNFGQVYCRFDVVTNGKHPLGKYNFFFQDRDDKNVAQQVRVFAVLFDANSRYVFGDNWRLDVPEGDTINGDFAFYLLGNILANIHEELPKYNNIAQDIGELLKRHHPGDQK